MVIAVLFHLSNTLIGSAWLFVFGYSITKISEKYGVKNTKFPAVGAQVVFWLLVLAWAVIGIGWLIYYVASKL